MTVVPYGAPNIRSGYATADAGVPEDMFDGVREGTDDCQQY